MMRKIVHIGLGLLLSLCLLASGIAAASAGVKMALLEGGGQIVICADGGASVVTVDALGRVVQTRKSTVRCAACALAPALAASLPVLIASPVTLRPSKFSFSFNAPGPRTALVQLRARAPPTW